MLWDSTTKTKLNVQMLNGKRMPLCTPYRTPAYSTQYAQSLATEIMVDQEQSLELVKTVISAAISNITWIRDVFPNECYESRVYDFSDPDSSYETFMNCQKAFALEKNQNLAYWRVLVRGSDPGVDKFLDWLERGVAHALERKYLSTLQLSFYQCEVTPSDLIEAYVISITYDKGVPSLQLDKESRAGRKSIGTSLLLSDAKLGIRNLINGIIVSAQDLPGELPPNHIADMHITYNDTCPKEYNPPGFRACDNPSFIVNEKLTSRCDSLNTGHHEIQIRLFRKRLREDEFTVAETVPTNPPDPVGTSPPFEMYGGETNESDQNTIKNTDAATRDTAEKTQNTEPLGEIDQPHSYMNRADLDYHNAQVRAQNYSQAIKLRIEQARQQRGAVLALGAGNDLCGVQNVLQKKLQCGICDHLKHVQCYGYLSRPSTSEFVCYSCLLQGENILLSEMKKLCLKRRALYHLRGGDLVSGKDLAAYLSRDEITAKTILGQLECDNVIKRSQPRQKGGKFGQYVFTLINNEAKLQRDYFCPILNIAHHLALVETPVLNILSAQSLPQSIQPHTPWATSQPSLYPSISKRDDSQQLMPQQDIARLGEGSRTQGTPSPGLDDRITSTPQPRTPASEMGRLVPKGKKRPAGTGMGGASRKHIKVSSARSPWLFGRVEDKASL
ncbi:hypothetical protein OIDMADRAFT_177279 [Oidiodendron maius Zn]|uniref:HORMA domain-containing protein n=1 Tax=Oidiodendron maius (strain Zn) TaxID=913774 RepID=A0A0C3H9J4_OIDMZ|nr:hypothetical protein OIDMADRAFT_177279 [Oidiodendron maius Zn]